LEVLLWRVLGILVVLGRDLGVGLRVVVGCHCPELLF
jgi:hypothetical protein